MGVAWGQIQHITGFQQPFLLGLKVAQDFQRNIGLQRQVFLAADTPAALPLRLQQEHVVAIKVRSHTAAVGGKTHHQVIQARTGHKGKLLQQGVRRIQMQVQALHQQGPARLAELGDGRAHKRAVAQAPSAALRRAADQARLDIVLPRQRKECGARQQRLHAGDGLTNQQGLFLPILAHETLRADAPEQSERLRGVHGGGVRE